ncbi:zf-HC2 domain-containing protein [Nocardia sp. AG03]|uniref:anti-sigma factor family protein n=1 Tax=Nocardia sp. AG03 TaxID=3025312 RepID=UPI002418A2DD|nr:zf-HC2 domain-containing protein [Nocardia sp. AG03]
MTDLADEYSTWDAAYVLGSLGATERRAYETHLLDCAHCQEAVAELSGLPGLLALVDRDTALAMVESDPAPVPDLLPALAATAERRRRRRRWLGIGSAVAAAAAAVAIAVPVTMTVARSDPATAQVVAAQQLRAVEQTPISAEVRLLRDGDRTRLVMTCRYAPSAYGSGYTWRYGLVVTTGDQRIALDQWPAGPGTELTVERTIDAAPESIDTVEITAVDSGRTVLVAEL